MSEHAQVLMLSTKIHATFGNTLMLAGVARIVEICFVPNQPAEVSGAGDRGNDYTLSDPGPDLGYVVNDGRRKAPAAKAFRHLPPFLLVAAGVLFISATDDELQFVDDNGMDHVTYLLIMFSIAFILYAFILALIHLYCTSGRNTAASNTIDENIELNPRSKKWHPPFSAEDADAHIIGEDDE